MYCTQVLIKRGTLPLNIAHYDLRNVEDNYLMCNVSCLVAVASRTPLHVMWYSLKEKDSVQFLVSECSHCKHGINKQI